MHLQTLPSSGPEGKDQKHIQPQWTPTALFAYTSLSVGRTFFFPFNFIGCLIAWEFCSSQEPTETKQNRGKSENGLGSCSELPRSKFILLKNLTLLINEHQIINYICTYEMLMSRMAVN